MTSCPDPSAAIVLSVCSTCCPRRPSGCWSPSWSCACASSPCCPDRCVCAHICVRVLCWTEFARLLKWISVCGNGGNMGAMRGRRMSVCVLTDCIFETKSSSSTILSISSTLLSLFAPRPPRSFSAVSITRSTRRTVWRSSSTCASSPPKGAASSSTAWPRTGTCNSCLSRY